MVDDFLRKAANSLFGSNNNSERERPASEDPYGDPAEVGYYDNLTPASEDPYADPGDQRNIW